MRVSVLFFGATAASAGEREVELDLREDSNAEDALQVILNNFPGLQANHTRKSLHFAINREYPDADQIIRPGDVLAVFTAVSGG